MTTQNTRLHVFDVAVPAAPTTTVTTTTTTSIINIIITGSKYDQSAVKLTKTTAKLTETTAQVQSKKEMDDSVRRIIQ